jgi:hypothetical protein
VIQTCPRCFSADDVSYERLPDRVVEFTCSRAHGDAGPYRWLASLDDASVHEETEPGVTDELLEPLSTCVGHDDAWLEYGIVEYRFRQRFPNSLRPTCASEATGCLVRIGSQHPAPGLPRH